MSLAYRDALSQINNKEAQFDWTGPCKNQSRCTPMHGTRAFQSNFFLPCKCESCPAQSSAEPIRKTLILIAVRFCGTYRSLELSAFTTKNLCVCPLPGQVLQTVPVQKF